jgi:DNA invertase Pin-like site-specific DNA recombinase
MANRRERGDAVTRREPTKYEEHKLGLARLTHDVRDGLRDGLTIAAVMAKHPGVSKRFVEEQRAFLRQTEGVPDPRKNSVADEVVRLSDQGLKPKTIAKKLGIHVSTVYRHRRRNG